MSRFGSLSTAAVFYLTASILRSTDLESSVGHPQPSGGQWQRQDGMARLVDTGGSFRVLKRIPIDSISGRTHPNGLVDLELLQVLSEPERQSPVADHWLPPAPLLPSFSSPNSVLRGLGHT